MLKVIRAFWPAIIWSLVIIFLSTTSGDNLSLPPFKNADKLAHLGVYYILSVLIIIGFSWYRNKQHQTRRAVWLALIASVILGGMLEIVQEYFLGSRAGDILDFFANTLGSFFAGLTFYVFKPARRLLK